jgi:hypothetical protein
MSFSPSPPTLASSQLILQNKKVLYDLLFRASADALLQVAADPKHLGAQIGFLSVLHTWGQNLLHHPHIHCVIPSGGLSPDRTRWIHPRYSFFLPVGILRKVFRGKFVAGLKRSFQQDQLTFHGALKPLENEKAFLAFLRTLFHHEWVVYAKRPFGGPHHVLAYLAAYTHRVAISNHRLLAFHNDQVTFLWKDYAQENRKNACPCPRRSSCVVSFYTFCLPASSASASPVSWPTAVAQLYYLFVRNYYQRTLGQTHFLHPSTPCHNQPASAVPDAPAR